jgi:hypothetical protein
MEPWIQTFTGKRLNPLKLRSKDIEIEDIAHALACVNRFAGHAIVPISVAQHSVMVSRLAFEATNSDKIALQGLLHDGSEAYLGDMTKWLKMSPEMKAYRDAEAWAQEVIFDTFDCPLDLHPEVESADRFMVRYEAEKAFGGDFAFPHPDYLPPTKEEKRLMVGWQPWSWRRAEEIFLAEYRTLT